MAAVVCAEDRRVPPDVRIDPIDPPLSPAAVVRETPFVVKHPLVAFGAL